MSVLSQQAAELFYFGRPDQQLFGVLNHAQTYAPREYGIVICYPFGQEYIRSHRACHHLALQLAVAGFPTLRFEYTGTGDSAGEPEDADVDVWRADIGCAIDVLRDRLGLEYICLLGVRLGGSLATEVAALRDDVSALILWEPAVQGSVYLAELAEQHQEMLWRFFDNPDEVAGNMLEEYLGFPISATQRSQLEQLDLLAVPPPPVEHALIVERQRSPAIAELHDRFQAAGVDAAYEQIPSVTIWREDVDKGLVPNQVIQGIVAWAEEVLP